MSTEDLAQRLWNNAGQLKGPVVEAYYAWRGVAVPKTGNLRFVDSLGHKSGVSYPAIIARAVDVNGAMTGVQRTFLAHDGAGKAPVDKKLQKMSFGVIKGSMVHLAEPGNGVPLTIGEGVETTATVVQATGWPGWASLGTSGLSAGSVPEGSKDIILLGENDGGKNARAIARIAPDLKRVGIRVRVAWPPEGFKDFNDMVMGAADQAAAFEAVRATIEAAEDFADPLDDLVERAKTDPGAPLEIETLARLKELRGRDPAAFMRLVDLLSKAGWRGVTELKRLTENRLDGGDDKSPTEILVELATAPGNDFFHTDLDDGFAYVKVGKHRETLKIGSRYFSLWLTEKFYRVTGEAPSKSGLDQAVATLKAKALFDGDERKVFVRVAAYGDKIYVDLCDAERRVIEIDAIGWRIVTNAPVHFHRIRGMLPLPVPVAGGSIQLLRPFLNIEPANDKSDDPSGQFTLTVGWIVGAFRGKGPYAILVTLGEQGAAKTTFCRLMKHLVDPNFAPLRDPPSSKRELAISGANSHVLAYDNISSIPDWLSDAWCRRASGAGNSERELYTDDEEILTNKSNPMTVNGIAEFVDRPDLAERSIFINLLPISDDVRKTEEEFFAEFDAAHSKILGAIFDLLSAGFRRIAEVRSRGLKLPRMADFSLWATACTEGAFGRDAFRKNYADNIQDAVSSVLEASPVALALIAEMDEGEVESVARTANQWLEVLSTRAGKRISKSRDWPSTPRAMSAQLKRAAGYLRKVGLDVAPSKPSGHKRDRLIIISRVKSFRPAYASSASSSRGTKSSDFNSLNADLGASKSASGNENQEKQPSAPSGIFHGAEPGDLNSQQTGAKGLVHDRWEIDY